MKSKYKLTSFARFILFMAVFLPGSYLGIQRKKTVRLNKLTTTVQK